MPQHDTTTNRGQAGIDTLVVFIAMLLVAALTAGVLINATGVLTTQADITTDETDAAVSNTLIIHDATGQLDDGSVDDPQILVGLGPSSDPINLDVVEILAVGDNGRQTFSGSELPKQAISGDDETLLIRTSDRVAITLDGLSLAEGEQTELIVTTADGSQTTKQLSVPNSTHNTDIRL